MTPASTLTSPAVKNPTLCPSEFCSGYMVENPNYIDNYGNGEPHCSVCGKTAAQAEATAKEIKAKNKGPVTQAPSQPKMPKEFPFRGDKLKRGIYLREHANEIQNDLSRLGNKAVIKKWGISSATIFKLQQEGFLSRAKHHVKHGDTKPGPTPPPSVNVTVNHTDNKGLPAFPEFKDSWDKETQIKWLEIYVQLKGKVPA